MGNRKIEEIDKNFALEDLETSQVEYHSVKNNNVLKLHGLCIDDKSQTFCRLPADLRKELSTDIQDLSWHTTGGRIRFATTSSTVYLKVHLQSIRDMPHMPRSGNSGFDFYTGTGNNSRFAGIVIPPENALDFEGAIKTGERKMREWTVNFPLYNGVKEVYIGLDESEELMSPCPYSIASPVVFYGSSITQGGCASRPGNSYVNILSRLLDADIYNLGFSGSAVGSAKIAEYISGLDMSAFVMDYDYNAPSVDHLRETHQNFFNIIREKRKNLPVVFITKPDYDGKTDSELQDNILRKDIISETYSIALEHGDQFVRFIDGKGFFDSFGSCTVDTTHPNDLGFMRMAEGIIPVLHDFFK